MRLQKLSKISWASVAVCLLIGLAITVVFAGGNYKLAYRLNKGQNLKYMLSMNMDQSMEMQGREMHSQVSGASFVRMEVEEVGKEGNITFVYAVDSLRLQVKSIQMDTTFRNPEGLVGKRSRQIMTAHGKKLKSMIVDSVKLSGMFAQLGGSRQTVFRLVELPEKEMKIDDAWTTSTMDTLEQGSGKTVVTPNRTYTIAAEVDTLDYKCLRITYKGTTTIKGEGQRMGMNFFIEGEGPTQGTLYFAPKEGLLVAMNDITDLEMTIAITGQMSMTMPQTTSTKTSLILVK